MTIRPAAVAGMFYPGEREALQAQLAELMEIENRCGPEPDLLIVPHAGYQYSGKIAAQAYSKLGSWSRYERVLMLGPSHRVPLRGIALSGATAFATPLGKVTLDQECIAQLVDAELAIYNPAAHELEHSLEVQLPFLQFLQCTLPLIPVVVGVTTRDDLVRLISFVTDRYKTLIVISTDLSHFHSYNEAQTIDRETINEILRFDSTITPEQACGCFALNGALRWFAGQQAQIKLISYANSGDIAEIGDKRRVVGYAALSAHL